MKEPRIPHPTSPGEMLLEEFLVPLELSQSELARRIGTSPRAINEICNCKRAVSPIMAMKFASEFNNTPEFWMNLQTSWDLWKEWEKCNKRRKSA